MLYEEMKKKKYIIVNSLRSESKINKQKKSCRYNKQLAVNSRKNKTTTFLENFRKTKNKKSISHKYLIVLRKQFKNHNRNRFLRLR